MKERASRSGPRGKTVNVFEMLNRIGYSPEQLQELEEKRKENWETCAALEKAANGVFNSKQE